MRNVTEKRCVHEFGFAVPAWQVGDAVQAAPHTNSLWHSICQGLLLATDRAFLAVLLSTMCLFVIALRPSQDWSMMHLSRALLHADIL